MINETLAVPVQTTKQKQQPLKESTFTLVSNKEVYKNTEMKLFEDHIIFSFKVNLFIIPG
jgi:hypothetical protein